MKTKSYLTTAALPACALLVASWAPTTAFAQNTIVQPTNIQASSQAGMFSRGADQVINGDGLASPLATGDPVPGTFPTHTGTASGNMWTSALSGDPGFPDPDGFLRFDLGGTFSISELHFWGKDSGASVKDVEISFSTTAIDSGYGTAESFTFTEPPSRPFDVQTITFSSTQTAQFVELDILSNHDDLDSTTVGEVRFTAVPEPASFALIGGFLALGAVMLRRRRNS